MMFAKWAPRMSWVDNRSTWTPSIWRLILKESGFWSQERLAPLGLSCAGRCRGLSWLGFMMLDHEETGLFHLRVEMQAIASIPMETAVADIRDHAQEIEALFHKYRPHLVLHAAAYKHVGMMERQPEEAVKNNVHGTLNLGEIACETGVDRFVLISTDKAVNPRAIVKWRDSEIVRTIFNQRVPLGGAVQTCWGVGEAFCPFFANS